MIEFSHKKDCCGCNACVQICPRHCIQMKEDLEGFLYPIFDSNSCVECHLCEKVCPVLNQNHSVKPLNVYAVKNLNDEVRKSSSSGGFFSVLAESIINQGGVVFGAGFKENWEVAHFYTETVDGISAFRMSKYTQSTVGNTFKETEMFLKQGRRVLYSGTPCQISGLKHYLRKEYENLLTIDIICHGVPSPGVFRWYLAEKINNLPRNNHGQSTFVFRSIPQVPDIGSLASDFGYKIIDIKFRDKRLGWKKYCFTIDILQLRVNGENRLFSCSSPLDKNPFLRGFSHNLYLRPSCHSCPAKNLTSGSDLTIGDFWGIEQYPGMTDDDKGTSVVILNTNKGKNVYSTLDLISVSVDFDFVCKHNSALVNSTPYNENRDKFFFKSRKSFVSKVNDLCRLPFYLLIRRFLRSVLRKIIKLFTK